MVLSSDAVGHGKMPLARQRLFDLDFVDATSVDQVLAVLLATDPGSIGDLLPLVVTPNVDHVVQLRHAEPAIVDSTRRAAVVLPDGQPIVWTSRLAGHGLRGRLTGSDLFAAMCDSDALLEQGMVVLAPSTAVAEGLTERHPAVRTFVAPMFEAGDHDARRAIAAEVREALHAGRARHVAICIGQPKQQLIALDLLGVVDDPCWVYCLGAAADLYLGLERRAPQWMRRVGIEWAFRLVQQPGRLLKRYLVDDLAFFPMAWREIRRSRA